MGDSFQRYEFLLYFIPAGRLIISAIAEHERQSKVIDDQKRQIQHIETRLARIDHDLDVSRRETQGVRIENAQLRAEIAALQNASSNPPYHAVPPPAPPVSHNSYPMPPVEQLPPLRNIPAGPDSMNGVQYSHDQRNGYRPTSERF